MHKNFIAFTTLLAFCLTARAQEADTSGPLAVAERLCKIAQITLNKKDVGDDNFRQAEALLQAACKLAPGEVRFWRLLIEAELQLKDTEGAIEALHKYLELQRNDQVARVQLVDLYLAQMESAEARLKYLNDLLSAPTKSSAEFRAAVAVRAAKLHIDRDESQAAWNMIDKALDLNPHDPDACALHWARTRESADPSERVAAVLSMIRANPTDANTLILLGDELASIGMHEPAQQWYVRALELAPRTGKPLDSSSFLNSAVSAFVLGQAKTAESRVAVLLQQENNDFDTHVMNLLCARRIGTEQPIADALAKASDAAFRRINAIHKEIAGEESPTTKPAGELAERIPDVAADAAAVKQKNDPALTEAYAQALIDLSYLTIYFSGKPSDADPLLAALRTLLPENSVVLTRLEGWQLLVAGQKEQAHAKLSSIADSDPLSKMGLIKLAAEADKAAAETEATALLSAHPSGLLAAIITDGFADMDVRTEPNPDVAAAVSANIAKFDMRWLDILENPSDFYSLTANAGKVPFQFGEPMVVTVTIKNNGPFDIPLGPNGTIRPDLWFDCSIKTAGGGQVPGVTFERFGQKLLLRRNESLEHTCRIDQGGLWGQIQSHPEMSFPLYFSVFTNPVSSQSGVTPGPAGYRCNMKIMERQSTALMSPNVRTDIFKKLTLGDPGTKIRVQEMFAQFISLISQTPNADQAADTMRQLREAIEQGMTDASPAVRGWATYVTTMLSADDRKAQLALKQASSKDWLQRVMVLTSADSLAPATQAQVFEKLLNDPEPIVKNLAEATRDYLARAAATTQPSGDAPATQPGS